MVTAMTDPHAPTRLGARMRNTRDLRGLSIDGAAAQARVSARVFEAVEEFGPIACTDITLRRILDWLDQ